MITFITWMLDMNSESGNPLSFLNTSFVKNSREPFNSLKEIF